MPQFFFLKATNSVANSGGPLVVELGDAISPPIADWPASYQLQLAAQQTPTPQAPIPNANQLWFLSETDGGTMICNAGNPALAIGYNFSQRYDFSFQAIACTPVTANQNQWIWTIANGSAAGHATSVTFNNTAGPPFDYYLNVYDNTMAAGTIIILYPYTGAVNTGAYFILEPYVPQLVSLQTNAPDAANVSGNFVIGFAGGIVEAQAQPTMQAVQPGALSQLWAFNPDGTIRNAADLSLAITAPASVDNPITMQAVTGAPAASQIWSLTGNMTLTNTASGDSLNVRGYSAAAGTEIITWASNTAPNETWTLLPYQPEPSGQYFTINSGLSSWFPRMLTACCDGTVVIDAALGLLGAEPTINQLWRLTLDGNIVSALNPGLGLSSPAGGGQVALAALRPRVPGQRWAWDHGTVQEVSQEGTPMSVALGALVNLGVDGGQCLTVQGGAIAAGTPVCTEAGPGAHNAPPPQQLWYVQPAGPAYGTWTPIRSTSPVQIDGRTTTALDLVLTIDGTNATLPSGDSGPYNLQERAVIDSRAGDAAAIWHFTPDGYIVNSLDPTLVLSLAVSPSSTLSAPVYDSTVVVSLRSPQTYPCQLWTTTAAGIIYNRQNGQVLTVDGTFDPKKPAPVPVVTSPLASPPAPTQIWDIAPGKALQTVLAQPRQPFPGTASDKKAYQYIDTQLGLKGITLRAQYMNLAAPLSSYQAGLATMPPGNFSNWDAIVAQLSRELTAAIAVQSLFQQISAVHVNLGLLQTMALQELVTLLELTPGTQVPHKKSHGWIWDIVSGMVYTALNWAGAMAGDPKAGSQFEAASKFASKGISVLANLLQTGFTAGQANIEANSGSGARTAALQKAEQYEMTVAQLQQALLATFNQSGLALGQIESLILSDWGKLEQVYGMICDLSGLSSLYWSGSMGPMQANKLLKGYMVQVLQTLMPLNSSLSVNGVVMHGPPNQPMDQLGLQPDGRTYIQQTQDGRQNTYKAGGNADVLSILWANGAHPYSYFHGIAGWALPINYSGLSAANLYDQAAIVVVIVNNTPQPMWMHVAAQGVLGPGGSVSSNIASNVLRPLPAFGTQSFAGINVPSPGAGCPFDGDFYLLAGTADGPQIADVHIGTNYGSWNWEVASQAEGYAVALSSSGNNNVHILTVTVSAAARFEVSTIPQAAPRSA
jgi:hypothetical protein